MSLLRKPLLFFLIAVPGLMIACPFCAGRDSTFQEIIVPISALLGAPFLLFGIVALMVVRQLKKETKN